MVTSLTVVKFPSCSSRRPWLFIVVPSLLPLPLFSLPLSLLPPGLHADSSSYFTEEESASSSALFAFSFASYIPTFPPPSLSTSHPSLHLSHPPPPSHRLPLAHERTTGKLIYRRRWWRWSRSFVSRCSFDTPYRCLRASLWAFLTLATKRLVWQMKVKLDLFWSRCHLSQLLFQRESLIKFCCFQLQNSRNHS